MKNLFILLGLFVVGLFCGCGIEWEGDAAPSPAPTPAPIAEDGSEIVTGDEAKGVVVEPDFWLSDQGVLHNSLCRWYKKCDGKEWDGLAAYRNCETCGGGEPIVRRWNLPSFVTEK